MQIYKWKIIGDHCYLTQFFENAKTLWHQNYPANLAHLSLQTVSILLFFFTRIAKLHKVSLFGSGYSSGSGCQAIHVICLAQPRDIASVMQ